ASLSRRCPAQLPKARLSEHFPRLRHVFQAALVFRVADRSRHAAAFLGVFLIFGDFSHALPRPDNAGCAPAFPGHRAGWLLRSTRVEVLDDNRADPHWVTLVGLRDFDDLLGNELGNGIGAVRQSKRLQGRFVGCTHALDLLGFECRVSQYSVDRHYPPKRPPAQSINSPVPKPLCQMTKSLSSLGDRAVRSRMMWSGKRRGWRDNEDAAVGASLRPSVVFAG